MLNVEQKINQMFILGYDGETPSEEFLNLVSEGIGGVIFFTKNIVKRTDFKKTVKLIKKSAKLVKPFLSIDQEGGRVERTLNLYHGKSHYLSPLDSARKGEEYVIEQTMVISKELRSFGLNMNFAPVLDVNSNHHNPIISDRAYSADPARVVRFGGLAAKTYKESGIIPVGKHFPGHGETFLDSHEAMPVLDLIKSELEFVHVRPFKAVMEYLPAIMVAHINYKCFDKKPIPASISKNVITKYLRKELKYKGLVITDDMEMGGIKGFEPFDAVKLGIEAGVNLFIFRNSDEKTLNLIEQVKEAVLKGEIKESLIDDSIKKILETKRLFGIL